MNQNPVTVEAVDGVHLIRMSDPKTRNAASVEMVERLIDALDNASRSARAVLLTGIGNSFCSGANLGRIPDPETPGYDAGLLLETHYNPLMIAMRELSVPIVTAVNGPAAGLGAALALSGDLILAARTSFFVLPFDRIGLVCDSGLAYLLVRSLGRARTMEMLLLGERVSSPQAFDWGLVNRLVDDAALMDEAMALAQRLAAGSTTAFSLIRRIVWDSMEGSFLESLDQERRFQCDAGRTADHREGLSAFFGKRQPVFRGA